MLKNVKFLIPMSFFSMTTTLCSLLREQLSEHIENMKQSEDKNNRIILDNNKTEALFVVSAVWAFGGCLAEKDQKDYRKEFSSFWKN